MIISDDLKNKTDDELAKFQADIRGRVEYDILIEKEWERRARIKQHELDVKLMTKQVNAVKFSAILGVAAVIAGAIVGASLQYMLREPPQQCTQLLIQKEISASSVKPLGHPRDSKIVSQGQNKEKDLSSSLQPPQKVKNE
jgi:hypothetical protein